MIQERPKKAHRQHPRTPASIRQSWIRIPLGKAGRQEEETHGDAEGVNKKAKKEKEKEIIQEPKLKCSIPDRRFSTVAKQTSGFVLPKPSSIAQHAHTGTHLITLSPNTVQPPHSKMKRGEDEGKAEGTADEDI